MDPVVGISGTSSDQPVEYSIPGIDAAARQQLEAVRGEPVPQRLRELAAELGEALDRHRQVLAQRDEISG